MADNDVELGDSGAGFGPPLAAAGGQGQQPPQQQQQQRQDEAAMPSAPIDFEDIKDDDDADMEESPLKSDHIPSFWKMVLAVILMSVFGLLPAFLVWWTGRFEMYRLDEVKIGAPTTNHLMEFIRFSLFLWVAMATYWMLEWFVAGLPNQTIRLLHVCRVPVSKGVRYMAQYFVKSRHWFALAAWIVVVAIAGGGILYRPQFVRTLTAGLLTAKKAGSAADAVSNLQPVQNKWYYFERVLLVTIIFTTLFGMAKYLIELIKVSFHRMAFEDRVTDLNYRFQILSKLYHATRTGKKVKLERVPRNIHLIKDRMSDLTTEKKARELAEELYNKLAPPGCDFIVKDNLANFFDAKDLDGAFGVLDQDGHGDTNRDEIHSVVMELFHERKAVAHGIVNNDKIIHKLDWTLVAVAIFFTISFAIPIFGLGGASIVLIFGLIWTGFGFLFQNTAKQCFESFIFVFVEHAYDVGDRVIIDNEYLTVERVHIFTTDFRRWDGTETIIPNGNLAGKNIYNVRRSTTQTDFIDVSLAAATPLDKLYRLRTVLGDFAKSDPKSYTGAVELTQYDLDGDKVKAQFSVEYRTNFQDAAVRAARRNKFMAMLKESVASIGIEYFP